MTRSPGTIPRTCLRCGSSFLVPPSRTAGRLGLYCQRACVVEAVTRHGERRVGQTTPEYRIWSGIKTRCHNPRDHGYFNYGGRGITMWTAWRESFEAFFADVGRRPSAKHSIDRVDNNRGYEPGNVRWATRSEQARNRRGNRLLTFNGATRTATEWAAFYDMSIQCLAYRLKAGWSVERALTTPRPLWARLRSEEPPKS